MPYWFASNANVDSVLKVPDQPIPPLVSRDLLPGFTGTSHWTLDFALLILADNERKHANRNKRLERCKQIVASAGVKVIWPRHGFSLSLILREPESLLALLYRKGQ
jgi:hypothetical protein